MDEQVYKDRLKVIRTEVRKTTCRINEFTPEVVTLNHKDTLSTCLDEIKNVYRLTQDMIYELIEELNEETDAARIQSLERIESELTTMFKNNVKSVNEKMVELISAAGGNLLNVTSTNASDNQNKKEKIEIRIKNNLKKVK